MGVSPQKVLEVALMSHFKFRRELVEAMFCVPEYCIELEITKSWDTPDTFGRFVGPGLWSEKHARSRKILGASGQHGASGAETCAP